MARRSNRTTLSTSPATTSADATRPLKAAPRRIYLIDRPGSDQANFRIGNLGLARTDKDYYALLVANAILGDGTGSRLFQDIRERQGFAYDVASAVSALKTGGAFFGFAQSRNEVAAANAQVTTNGIGLSCSACATEIASGAISTTDGLWPISSVSSAVSR